MQKDETTNRRSNRKNTAWLVSVLLLLAAFPLILGIRQTFIVLKNGFSPNQSTEKEEPTKELSNVWVTRDKDAGELLSGYFEKGVVYRFASGKQFDGVFYTGGVLRLWVELERGAKKTKVFETDFNLTYDPEFPIQSTLLFSFVRAETDEKGFEKWRVYTRQEDQVSGAGTVSTASGEKVLRVVNAYKDFEQFFAAVMQRKDLTPEERKVFEKENLNQDSITSMGSFGAQLPSQNKDTCLSEHKLGFGHKLHEWRTKNNLPERPELDMTTIRVMCRLIKKSEQTDESQSDRENTVQILFGSSARTTNKTQ